MKKTLAAVSASVLGLASAATAAAVPASAADTTIPCGSLSEQLSATGNITDNWFQDCVPQYGLGKAEFTIVPNEFDPSEEFPDEFVDLAEWYDPVSGVEATSTLDMEAIFDYFDVGAPAPAGYMPPIVPIEVVEADASAITYAALVLAPVATIGNADLDTLPPAVAEACGVDTLDFAAGWVATYAPIDTTFTQEIDGAEWAYTIDGTPPPTYFLISETLETFCASDGVNALVGDEEIFEAFFIAFGAVMPYPPSSLLEDIDPDSLQSLGVFGRNGTEPLPPVTPQLAATGADAAGLVLPAVIVGGVVLLGGALVAVAAVRSKRRKDESA